MIKSKFILDVLHASLTSDDVIYEDGIQYGKLASPQIEYLTDVNYDYTGLGLFVSFSYTEEALKYKSSLEDGPLRGIDIKSPNLEDYANTIVWFREGIISSLEIFSVAGDYPKKDLENYSFVSMPVNIINNLPPKYEGNLLRYINLLLKHWFR